ncbi:hypothetical protein [Amycolatopsis jejuensis]|uniref:hypothetical protein n=1 Tax=Amycolatopsis jejuensis TaxID=330084 RepID=UPI00068FA185|nr:hypothetical protein [Amycolatopsis jejuensis]
MVMHRFVVAIGFAVVVLFGAAPATAAPARAVGVSGAVASPAEYSPADLAGASLYDVVVKAAPITPAGKNTALRVVVQVSGRHGQSSTFALGELDPAFGNHAATFTRARSGIRLSVPGDRNRSRDVADVRSIRVSVSDAGPQPVPPGAVRVVTVHRTTVVVPAYLPARTVRVTFQSGAGPQTHTETGPPLAAVLLAAGVLPRADLPVVAVGEDGYGAAVTLAEESVGGRPLVLSTVEDGSPLARPRLVPEGDVKGGRYVSGVVTLVVGL